MFGNLPVSEKQAFFSLLDEYFEARPHLLPTGQEDHLASNTYATSPPNASASPPPLAPRRSNPPPPAARKPAPSTPSRNAAVPPAGLSSGKSFGSLRTGSSGAAIGSILQGSKSREPVTPGEAISGLRAVNRAANRMNFSGDQQRGAPPPPPPPPGGTASNSLGQAEVIYEYKGTEAEDLNVRQFDIITLIEKVNDDWWKAESSDGRSGLVPATYVKVL